MLSIEPVLSIYWLIVSNLGYRIEYIVFHFIDPLKTYSQRETEVLNSQPYHKMSRLEKAKNILKMY